MRQISNVMKGADPRLGAQKMDHTGTLSPILKWTAIWVPEVGKGRGEEKMQGSFPGHSTNPQNPEVVYITLVLISVVDILQLS